MQCRRWDPPSPASFCRDVRFGSLTGFAATRNGTLAGTALDMAAAVRNAVSLLGLDVAEAARMASEYPAEFLGLGHELGRIAPGYRANLVLMDDAFKVHKTWIEGRVSV